MKYKKCVYFSYELFAKAYLVTNNWPVFEREPTKVSITNENFESNRRINGKTWVRR